MKKLVLFLIFCSYCAIETTFAQNFMFKGETSYRTKYVGPDGMAFYKKSVMQGSFTLTHKSGLYFEEWYSVALHNPRDWGDENDHTLGYGRNLFSFSIDVSLSYFDNFKVFHCPSNDVIKAKIYVELPEQISKSFKLSEYVNYTNFQIPGKDNPLIGGNLFSLGVTDEVNFLRILKSSSLFQITRDDGAFGVEPGLMFKFSSSLGVKLSEHWNLNVEAMLYSPNGKRKLPNGEIGFMPNELVLNAGLSWIL